MNDKELEALYAAIEDFSAFHLNVLERRNVYLKGGFSINFLNEQGQKTVEIEIAYKKHILDDDAFFTIMHDILTEKDRHEKVETQELNKELHDKLENDILKQGDREYRVHEAFVQHMLTASDIASAHEVYLRKLRMLLSLLENRNTLYVNEKKIETAQELKMYLKSIGSYFIDKDIP